MTDDEIKELFKLQSRNVRHLKKVEKNLTMDINYYLLKGDDFKVKLKTNFYSLLYSLLSEAQFLQILHTPHGFTYPEIQQIKKQSSIVKQWEKMLDIALNKVGDFNTDTSIAQKRTFLRSIITQYIEEPQNLRNKIAHGQWVHALNSKNTKENTSTTNKIDALNVVEISKWFSIHQYLCFIIRDLVQSDLGVFNNSFNDNYAALNNFVIESSGWTLAKRITDIKTKYSNRKQIDRE